MKRAYIVLVALALAFVAGCSGSDGGTVNTPPPSGTKAAPAPTGKVGQPFTNSGFRITVTKVVLNQARFPGTATASDDPAAQTASTKGQFVFAYLTVTNTDKEPNQYDNAAKSTITDASGKDYAECECDVSDQPNEFKLRTEQAPGATVTGIIAFDVPKSVTSVKTITIQPTGVIGGDNERTAVAVS